MNDIQLRGLIEKVLMDYCHNPEYTLRKAIRDMIIIVKDYKKKIKP